MEYSLEFPAKVSPSKKVRLLWGLGFCGFGLLERGLGLISGRFRVKPYENAMAVRSQNQAP